MVFIIRQACTNGRKFPVCKSGAFQNLPARYVRRIRPKAQEHMQACGSAWKAHHYCSRRVSIVCIPQEADRPLLQDMPLGLGGLDTVRPKTVGPEHTHWHVFGQLGQAIRDWVLTYRRKATSGNAGVIAVSPGQVCPLRSGVLQGKLKVSKLKSALSSSSSTQAV